MIQNQRQYQVTKSQIATLTRAREGARDGHGKVPPRIYRSMIAGIESLIEELRQQLREYEELQRAACLHVGGAEDLPEALIKARIARGYTQKELAEKLGLQPQQVQRYEATGYRSVSLKRLLDVMRALDLKLEADIPLRPIKEPAAEQPAETAVGERVEPYARGKRPRRDRR
jgi:transcriptional regulator with XRE-family HTH domain